MKSFSTFLLRLASDFPDRESLPAGETVEEEIRLLRFLSREPAAKLGLAPLSDGDCRNLLLLSEELFLRPTRHSRELAEQLKLSREELLRLYRIIRQIPQIQELLTFESPLRRRVSFLRRELLPANSANLESMFKGEVCLPNHVEFHLALMCNLRCRACPNCQFDHNGEWHFLGYPKIGQALDQDRLRQIQEMLLDLGVESFSFGGGGEPTLSPLLLAGIAHLREKSAKVELALYTNGIFPDTWGDAELATLVGCLNKLRFSIDASNAEEWSQYKGRPPEFFEVLWENIGKAVARKKALAAKSRIGASCLVSTLTYRNVEAFLLRARDAGLDFCDIKEVETCFGEKSEYRRKSPEFRESFDALLARIRGGFFAPMDVVVDDSLLASEENPDLAVIQSTPCWIAVRGRMLTVGPYGELYPCSDAANPGSQKRRALQSTIGRLSAYDRPEGLRDQFIALWTESLTWRRSLSRANCAYCVPSHTNYNLAVDKLFEDWRFGIVPEEQAFAGVRDHYLASRGAGQK